MKLFGLNFFGGEPVAAVQAARQSKPGRTAQSILGPAALTIAGGPLAESLDPDLLISEGAKIGRVRPRVQAPIVMHLPPHFSTTLGRAYAARHGALLADSELAAIQSNEAEYAELHAKLMALHAVNVGEEWLAATSRGEHVGSLEDYKHARVIQSRNQQRQLSGIVAELFPIQHSVAKKLGAFAAELADEYQEKESSHLAAFGVEYHPSRLITLLRSVASNPNQLINVTTGLPPAKALAWASVQLTA